MNTINLRCQTTKKSTRSRKKRDKVTYGEDFRQIQKLQTLAIAQIHTISAGQNSELIWPDKREKEPNNTLVRKKSDMPRSL